MTVKDHQETRRGDMEMILSGLEIRSSGGSWKIPWRFQLPKQRGICDELCDYQLFKNNPA
jgi:hypothetical protein